VSLKDKMKYTGEERRKATRLQDHKDLLIICKQEDKIDKIFDSIHRTESAVDKLDMRLLNSLDKMSVHVEDSIYWRRFIVGVAISLVLSIVGGSVALFSLSYNLGTYTRQIVVNTDRLDQIEKEHRLLRDFERK
jgi:putative NADH-flavin reductase